MIIVCFMLLIFKKKIELLVFFCLFDLFYNNDIKYKILLNEIFLFLLRL